ncbi:MAG: toxin-antitoxin system TumE family protein [Nitrospirota bacterium]
MKNAHLVRHVKAVDELGNIIEVKMWRLLNPSKDKPHGYKYSLVYIVAGRRVIGYDNAEGKGDHKHYGARELPYSFTTLRRLVQEFYRDIEKFKRGEGL